MVLRGCCYNKVSTGFLDHPHRPCLYFSLYIVGLYESNSVGLLSSFFREDRSGNLLSLGRPYLQ